MCLGKSRRSDELCFCSSIRMFLVRFLLKQVDWGLVPGNFVRPACGMGLVRGSTNLRCCTWVHGRNQTCTHA